MEELIGRQIDYNTAISDEGLKGNYGVETGRILMENAGNASGLNRVRLQARAAAAAGSDARMSGCALPVVIISGSGNQGITVTMPIVIYGRAWQADRELILRALVLANLHQRASEEVHRQPQRLLRAPPAPPPGPPAAWPI